MSLWDNITQKAAAVTDKAVHQAKNFTEQVKLRNQISEEIGADHQDKTRHKKHPAESPWPDARNSKNRELAR